MTRDFAPRPSASASASLAGRCPDAFELEHLSFAEAVCMGQSIRALTPSIATTGGAARAVVDYLYDTLQSSTGAPACALARCFVTAPFGALPAFAQRAGGPAPQHPHTRCLWLLATRGELASWNAPATSVGHHVIPLPDVAMIERAPMIARLFRELGVAAEAVVNPDSFAAGSVRPTTFNVFHVEDALGSAYIPAQDTFVVPHGVRSVLGMGGVLPSGQLFAIILFARVPIAPRVASLFRTLALSIKLTLIPFDDVLPSPIRTS